MEDKHSILYNHYSKYNAGNPALLRSVGSISKNILTKLPNITKSILKDVINDLPGKMKDEFRDRIASNLLQGKNPITELSSDIKNRVYNDIVKDGNYSLSEINKVFHKGPIYFETNDLDNLDNLGNNLSKQYPVPKSYSEFFNFPPTNHSSESSENSDDSSESDNQQLYGGSIYKQKYYKYKYKYKN